MHLALRIERHFGTAVRYNLKSLKQPATPHVADKGMIAEPLLQPPRQMRAVLWQYRFTTPAEKRAQGAWWRRQLLGLYAPTLER